MGAKKQVTLDARGLSCPEPAMQAKDAMDEMKEGVIEVLLDSGTSRDNVTRVAQRAGWSVSTAAEGGGVYRLTIRK